MYKFCATLSMETPCYDGPHLIKSKAWICCFPVNLPKFASTSTTFHPSVRHLYEHKQPLRNTKFNYNYASLI